MSPPPDQPSDMPDLLSDRTPAHEFESSSSGSNPMFAGGRGRSSFAPGCSTEQIADRDPIRPLVQGRSSASYEGRGYT